MTIKNAVKVARNALKISGRELAERARVSPSTITNIEEGKDVTLSVAQQVAAGLNVSLQDLINLEEALSAPNNELLAIEARMHTLALQMINPPKSAENKAKPVAKEPRRLAHA